MLGELHYSTKFLTSEECDFLVDHYKTNQEKTTRSMIGFAPTKVDLNYRISKTLQLDIEKKEIKTILEKISETAKHMNEELFLFSINWEDSWKSKNFQVIEYDGSEKGFWTKHQNVNWISNASQRKLCATVILSDSKDYEGGDFILYFGSSKDQPTPIEMRTKGTLIVYPAFRFTQIMPVLSGKKYHLDLYWEGPYWR